MASYLAENGVLAAFFELRVAISLSFLFLLDVIMQHTAQLDWNISPRFSVLAGKSCPRVMDGGKHSWTLSSWRKYSWSNNGM